jgi:hypothetical protein
MLTDVLRAVGLGKTYRAPSGDVVALTGFDHAFPPAPSPPSSARPARASPPS